LHAHLAEYNWNRRQNQVHGEATAMSTILRSDASGAVTLPAELCKIAGIEPETELVAEILAGQIVLGVSRPPFWERIAALSVNASPEELDKVSTDAAAQIDHYLYGHRKQNA
jgi:antitoxin component of MazEF toxin-antitoxin module